MSHVLELLVVVDADCRMELGRCLGLGEVYKRVARGENPQDVHIFNM